MFSGRWAAGVVVCLALAVTGCNDDEPEGDDPPPSPTSLATDSSSPTAPTSPTDPTSTVEPATGPELTLKGVSLRLPEGWEVSSDDSNILVVGAEENGDAVINLSSFPSIAQDVTLAELARSTIETGGYPKDSMRPPTTMAGQPAFHVAGTIMGEPTEEFGLLHRGDIVSVEFVFIDYPKGGEQEVIDSVLATVTLP